jgi:SAM-dependent methyltransferase
LAYARDRAAALGVRNVRFLALDLHDVPALGQRFDHVECAGVLHHLRDPEAGWRALTTAAVPGATMRIALYSRRARQGIVAARAAVADGMPACPDDVDLRRARAFLMAAPAQASFADVWSVLDFYSLPGFHDLVLNAHEDPFDIPRIANALRRLNLRFLGFDLIDPIVRKRKATLFPDHAPQDDLASWAAYEALYPETFRTMYHFWCECGADSAE